MIEQLVHKKNISLDRTFMIFFPQISKVHIHINWVLIHVSDDIIRKIPYASDLPPDHWAVPELRWF